MAIIILAKSNDVPWGWAGDMALPEACYDRQKLEAQVNVDHLISDARPLGNVTFTAPPGGDPSNAVHFRFFGEDLVNIARMAMCEAGGRSDEHVRLVIWTTIQRMAHLPRFRNWRNFSEYIHEFSEPMMEEGAAYAAECDCESPPDRRCERACRRADCQTRPWDEIPQRFRRAALDFALGRLHNPSWRSINFGQYRTTYDRCATAGDEVLRYDPHGRRVTDPPRPLVETTNVFCTNSRVHEGSVIVSPPRWLECFTDSQTRTLRAPEITAEVRQVLDRLQGPQRSCD